MGRRASTGIAILLAFVPLACGGNGTPSGATGSTGATSGPGPGGGGGHGGAGGSSSSSGGGGASSSSGGGGASSSSGGGGASSSSGGGGGTTSSSSGTTGTGGQGGSGGSGVCVPGATQPCYEGEPGTQGAGACKPGIKTCDAGGTAFGACEGQVLPVAETCATPGDDDCNGLVNEGGAGCVCVPGATSSCYSGPAGTQGVGACKAGSQVCDGQGTSLGACAGAVLPQAEICGDPLDNNCDGQVDEGCACAPGTTTPCYTGAAGTQGVGPCHAGVQTCNGTGDGYGACAGEVVPQTETCTTPVDDNCNGQTNEGGVGCVCAPGVATACYSGPAGTQGVGACAAGTKICNGQGTAYGACQGEIVPVPETCATLVDDDCNGQTNEGGAGCVCAPNATVSCYSGPAGTAGVGICKAGSQVCNGQGTAYGACAGTVLPQPENCVTPADEDCDGVAAPCSGTHLWSKSWGGSLDDEGNAVAVDAADNVFFGGYATGPVDVGCGPLPVAAGNDAAMVMKLTKTGACTWSKSFGSNSQVFGLAVDPSGNAFATGTFGLDIDLGSGTVTTAGGNDGFLVKLTSGGTPLWSRTFGDSQTQSPDAVATDASGNVVAYGSFNGTIDLGGGPLVSAGGTDLYVAKYSPTGTHLWSKSFGDATNQLAKGVAVDTAGNIVITGTMYGAFGFGGATLTSLGNGDVFVAKLGPTGTHLWSKVHGDAAPQIGQGVAIDPSDNVFLTGYFLGTINFGGMTLPTAGSADSYLAKLDPAGNHLWSIRGGGPGNQSFNGCAVDRFGNVSVVGVLLGTGTFGGQPLTSAGSNDLLMAKYDPAGNHLWSKSFGDAASQGPKGMAVDSVGNVLATGLLFGPTDFGGGPVTGAGGEDSFLVKLGP